MPAKVSLSSEPATTPILRNRFAPSSSSTGAPAPSTGSATWSMKIGEIEKQLEKMAYSTRNDAKAVQTFLFIVGIFLSVASMALTYIIEVQDRYSYLGMTANLFCGIGCIVVGYRMRHHKRYEIVDLKKLEQIEKQRREEKRKMEAKLAEAEAKNATEAKVEDDEDILFATEQEKSKKQEVLEDIEKLKEQMMLPQKRQPQESNMRPATAKKTVGSVLKQKLKEVERKELEKDYQNFVNGGKHLQGIRNFENTKETVMDGVFTLGRYLRIPQIAQHWRFISVMCTPLVFLIVHHRANQIFKLDREINILEVVLPIVLAAFTLFSEFLAVIIQEHFEEVNTGFRFLYQFKKQNKQVTN